jgi:predicted nucleic acid-binding protein
VRTAIDTNAISVVWSGGSLAPQAASLLGRAAREGGMVICGPVYAELLAHPKATERFVDEFLTATRVEVDFVLEESVWREAARRFAAYARRRRRSRGGQPKRLLVDFLIGAHAFLRADRLLTLDPDRYVRDFPRLRLI